MTTMNTKMKSYRPKHPLQGAPKIKTLNVRLSITNHDLGVEIKRAFDLARSAGQELNLSFSRGIG